MPLSSPHNSRLGFFLFLVMCCLGIPLFAMAQEKRFPLSAGTGVDSPPFPTLANGVCKIPYGTEEIFFRIGNRPPEKPLTKRVRYKLEGYDTDWRKTQAEMRFGIRFYNARGALVGEQVFGARGRSSGWVSTVDDSKFTHRREAVRVPDEAATMQVFMSSAGPPTCTGMYVVADVVVTKVTRDGNDVTLFDSASFLAINRNFPVSRFDEWIRDGNQPSMAKLIKVGGPGFNDRAFCLLDNDPLSHAEWHQMERLPVKVQPDEQLLIQWNEMYDIGDANSFYDVYTNVAPGRYRFVVNELDASGYPTDKETVLDILIPLPLWKNPWVWIPSLLAGVLALALFIRYLVQAGIRRRLEHLQQQHLVEQERLRIARDIHDDLGARLTQISLLSGMAENSAETEGDRHRFMEISGMARELVSSMYETVWTVNPQNDHLESLVSFLCQSTENLCKPAGIRCRIKVSPISENRDVRSEIRHNAILAVKETVHNAIKHSGSSEIELSMTFDAPNLNIVVTDGGEGFDMQKQKGGHGLKNLGRRMEKIGGSISVESTKGQGTRVSLIVPIPEKQQK